MTKEPEDFPDGVEVSAEQYRLLVRALNIAQTFIADELENRERGDTESEYYHEALNALDAVNAAMEELKK